jgi:hypothetical protein
MPPPMTTTSRRCGSVLVKRSKVLCQIRLFRLLQSNPGHPMGSRPKVGALRLTRMLLQPPNLIS